MIYLLDLENVSNQKPMLMQSGSTLEHCQFLRSILTVLFHCSVYLFANFLLCFLFPGMIFIFLCSSVSEALTSVSEALTFCYILLARHMGILHSRIVSEHLKKQLPL